MHHRLILTLIAIMTLSGIQARVRLSHLVGDNMIIQQDTEVRLWGWATPGTSVRVTTSWDIEVQYAVVGADSTWIACIHSPKASYTPLSITFDDGDKTTINNVLAGEVWLCTGQSNMEMPMKGYDNCPVEGYNEELVRAADYSGIHYCTLPMRRSEQPLRDSPCQWRVVGPQTLPHLSAVGYYFAQNLQRALGIPIGIVVAVKGGSRVEDWLDLDNLRRHTSEPTDAASIARRWPNPRQRGLFWGYGTISPVLHYTIKGILYYQGCSNVNHDTQTYAQRLALLARQWRRDFGLGDIPFYITQIAPCIYYDDPQGDHRGRLLEQQMMAADSIPNCGIVCTQDQVHPWEARQVHPAQKREIGNRLAYQALCKQYGLTAIQCESPRFESMTISADTCYITFSHTYKGITQRADSLQGFEVAGADHVFYPAVGYVRKKNLVYVLSPQVKHPVAVRYCFRNWQMGNVTNQALLPLFPFRTDHW